MADMNATHSLSGTETILVVEDERSVRNLVTNYLRRLGYRILEASNAAEAIALWAQNSSEIRLLLTDLIMPGGMSGFDLAEQLRSEAPQLKIIYTSGYSPEVAGRDVSTIPGVRFIEKPYPAAKLAETVREALNEHLL